MREQSRTLWFSATYVDDRGREYDVCIQKDYYELNGAVESRVVRVEWFGVDIYPNKAMRRDIEAAFAEADRMAGVQISSTFTTSVAEKDLRAPGDM